MNYALVERSTGNIVNNIVLEEGANWRAPDGFVALVIPGADIEDRWDGSVLIKAPEPPPPVNTMALVVAAADEVVASIDRAFTERSTALSQAEKDEMRGKVVVLIARAQGRQP